MPKFSLATLFWLILVAAIVCSFCLYQVQVNKERETAAADLAQAKQDASAAVAEVVSNMEDAITNAVITAHHFKGQMGHFNQKPKPDEFAINAYQLPVEFRGRMAREAPFHWYWRIHVGDPKKFELRVATKGIPQTGFNVDESQTTALTINPADPSFDGNMSYLPQIPINMERPVEILMAARADLDSDGGSVLVQWRMSQKKTTFHSGLPYHGFRSARIKVSAEDMAWMTGQHQFLRKLSHGWRVDQEIPDSTDHVFDITKPLLLMRIRKQKEVAHFKFERINEPTDGLMIWIVERTSPIKYELDGIEIKLPRLEIPADELKQPAQ